MTETKDEWQVRNDDMKILANNKKDVRPENARLECLGIYGTWNEERVRTG